MRRERMDSVSRYIYLFGPSRLYSRSSKSVLGAILSVGTESSPPNVAEKATYRLEVARCRTEIGAPWGRQGSRFAGPSGGPFSRQFTSSAASAETAAAGAGRAPDSALRACHSAPGSSSSKKWVSPPADVAIGRPSR
jgi:hypothetical protein